MEEVIYHLYDMMINIFIDNILWFIRMVHLLTLVHNIYSNKLNNDNYFVIMSTYLGKDSMVIVMVIFTMMLF